MYNKKIIAPKSRVLCYNLPTKIMSTSKIFRDFYEDFKQEERNPVMLASKLTHLCQTI